MKWLVDLLRDPASVEVDVDGIDRMRAHAEVLRRKRLMRETFQVFHRRFDALDRQFFSGSGPRVEIGAGVAPIRDTFPDVLATDLVMAPGIDIAVDAQDMPFEANSLRAIFGQNCFHHLPRPEQFLSESERVLCSGGGVVLAEPYHGPLASLIYPKLFATEDYDKTCPDWRTPVSGPMNGANQALSYIVFKRDRSLFEARFPGLEIVHEEVCRNYLTYVLSGGLNFRQLVPDFMAPLVGAIEWGLSPFSSWFGLHHFIVLRKR